jgi:hypothetical protein
LDIVLDTMDKEPAVAVVPNAKTFSHRIRPKVVEPLSGLTLTASFSTPLSPDCPHVVNPLSRHDHV